jgi:hypothetical protein
MPCFRIPRALLVASVAAVAACGETGPEPSESPQSSVSRPESATPGGADDPGAASTIRELQWDDLIPADWQPQKILEDFDAENLTDDDPRAQAMLDKLQELWRLAPVVPELDGKTVSLPGFVVPTEATEDRVFEFLLVPYMGACIHVPPPPANQTVYVVTNPGREYRGALFDPVTVTGQLRVKATDNELGAAGYFIAAESVAPYQ